MTVPLCPGCYYMLRELCWSSRDVRLCEAYGRYAETGDPAAIDRAVAVADPQLILAARRSLVGKGLLPAAAAPPDGGRAA